jgi:TPR repeat protein
MKIVLCLSLSAAVLCAATLPEEAAACVAGETAYCYRAGKALTGGENAKDQKKKEQGMQLLRKGCVYGDPRACDLLGLRYFDEKLYSAAHPYLRQACDSNVTNACTALGTIYRDGHDVKQDDVQARRYYTKACELGSADACINVALIYQGGFWVARSRERSRDFYQKACQAGSQMGCKRFRRLDEEDKGGKHTLWERLRVLFN